MASRRLAIAAYLIAAAAVVLIYPAAALVPSLRARVDGAISVGVPVVCSIPQRRLMTSATPIANATAPHNPLCKFQGATLCDQVANRLKSPTPLKLMESLVQMSEKKANQSTAVAKKLSQMRRFGNAGFVGSLKSCGEMYGELSTSLQHGLMDLKGNKLGKAVRNFIDGSNKIQEIIDEYAVNCDESPMHPANIQLFDMVRSCLGVLYNF